MEAHSGPGYVAASLSERPVGHGTGAREPDRPSAEMRHCEGAAEQPGERDVHSRSTHSPNHPCDAERDVFALGHALGHVNECRSPLRCGGSLHGRNSQWSDRGASQPTASTESASTTLALSLARNTLR